MKKIIICDINSKTVDYLRKELENYPKKTDVELEFVHGDVIELHEKTPNSRIVTASNPSFSPDGGLDARLASKYKWEGKEFTWSDDLFYVVSVNDNRVATDELITRALIGVMAYSYKFTMILTGIGTGIGGLSRDILLDRIITVLINADLSNANLRRANLSSANLSYADLRRANLSSANLSYADLRSADLSSANLSSANLRIANLSNADLSNADLSSAYLINAYLIKANLINADLSDANLRGAYLINADLSDANLRGANLSNANLRGASLSNVRYNECTAFFALACPEEGDFIGWKKAKNKIVKLLVPPKAKRSSATSRKCRCSEAKVLAIYDEGKEVKTAISNHDSSFLYTVGKTVKVKDFDADRWNECSTGIHFFITREEAEQWNN